MKPKIRPGVCVFLAPGSYTTVTNVKISHHGSETWKIKGLVLNYALFHRLQQIKEDKHIFIVKLSNGAKVYASEDKLSFDVIEQRKLDAYWDERRKNGTNVLYVNFGGYYDEAA